MAVKKKSTKSASNKSRAKVPTGHVKLPISNSLKTQFGAKGMRQPRWQGTGNAGAKTN